MVVADVDACAAGGGGGARGVGGAVCGTDTAGGAGGTGDADESGATGVLRIADTGVLDVTGFGCGDTDIAGGALDALVVAVVAIGAILASLDTDAAAIGEGGAAKAALGACASGAEFEADGVVVGAEVDAGGAIFAEGGGGPVDVANFAFFGDIDLFAGPAVAEHALSTEDALAQVAALADADALDADMDGVALAIVGDFGAGDTPVGVVLTDGAVAGAILVAEGLVGFALQADLTTVTVGVCGAGGVEFGGAIFVDLSIAVVVDIVAALVGESRFLFAGAGAPLAGSEAGARSGLARGVALVGAAIFGASGCAGVADLLLTGVADPTIFVGLAIAVVVFAVVALFSGGDDLAEAIAPLAVLAGLATGFADADIFGPGGSGITGSCLAIGAALLAGRQLIDLAVAVVVYVVSAGLGSGFDFAVASGPSAAVAGLCSFFAGTDVAGVGGTFIAGSGLSVVAGAAVFVDLAVAVVVEVVVADVLGVGSCISDTAAPFAASAGLGADTTDADVLGTRRAGVTGACLAIGTRTGRTIGAVVVLAVAVIIELVANFGGGQALAFTPTPAAFGAGLGPLFTDANAAGAEGAVITRLLGPFFALGLDACPILADFVGLAIGVELTGITGDIADTLFVTTKAVPCAIFVVGTFAFGTVLRGEREAQESKYAKQKGNTIRTGKRHDVSP